MPLNTMQNCNDPDGLYAAFIEMQEGVADEKISVLYTKAILLLANHIGDVNIIEEAFTIAKQHTIDKEKHHEHIA